jgi:two-component system phosphate regulon sensor histidine kinase PhoR
LTPAIDAAAAVVELRVSATPVWGDSDAIFAVVRNLVENALKYGGIPGGVPEIVIEAAPDSGGKKLHLSVSDCGLGIAPEFQGAVFRRFFRVDGRLSQPGSGVGLGLAICRHLVTKMKGNISVAANPGGGCRFMVTLGLPQVIKEDKPKLRFTHEIRSSTA